MLSKVLENALVIFLTKDFLNKTNFKGNFFPNRLKKLNINNYFVERLKKQINNYSMHNYYRVNSLILIFKTWFLRQQCLLKNCFRLCK